MIGRWPFIAAPMAMPVKPFSDNGISITRRGPYFCARFAVVPKIAFGSATPSPIRMTFGSAAIARSVASRIASPALISLASCIDVIFDCRGIRERRCDGKLEGQFDLDVDFAGQPGLAVLRQATIG